MLAHSGYLQLFILAWHIFLFFISKTKLCTRSQVSWSWMSHWFSPSTITAAEKAEGRRTKAGIRTWQQSSHHLWDNSNAKVFLELLRGSQITVMEVVKRKKKQVSYEAYTQKKASLHTNTAPHTEQNCQELHYFHSTVCDEYASSCLIFHPWNILLSFSIKDFFLLTPMCHAAMKNLVHTSENKWFARALFMLTDIEKK